MSGRAFLLGAIPAIALAAITTAANAPAPAVGNPESTWRAVVEWESGESDIVEHGASLPDCLAYLDRFAAGAVTYCELEG